MKREVSKINREAWIDWSKAILIWLMVLGHAGLSGVPRDFVYAFHMPAFFIISGFLYKPHSWWKTLKSFGIPILFFSAINLAFVVLKMELKGEPVAVGDLMAKITPPYWRCNFGEYISLFRGVWFIVVLFFMRLFMGDIPFMSSVRKYTYWIIPALVLYMTLEPLFENYTSQFQEFYLYKVIGCLPLMMFGVVLKEHKARLMTLGNWMMLGLFVLYVTFVLINGSIEIWAYTFGKTYIGFYACALAGSLLFFNLCKRMKNHKIAETFSKGTLLILGLHSIILEICDKLFDILHLPHLCVVSSIIVMLLCYYPIRWSLKYCPSILGK